MILWYTISLPKCIWCPHSLQPGMLRWSFSSEDKMRESKCHTAVSLNEVLIMKMRCSWGLSSHLYLPYLGWWVPGRGCVQAGRCEAQRRRPGRRSSCCWNLWCQCSEKHSEDPHILWFNLTEHLQYSTFQGLLRAKMVPHFMQGHECHCQLLYSFKHRF